MSGSRDWQMWHFVNLFKINSVCPSLIAPTSWTCLHEDYTIIYTAYSLVNTGQAGLLMLWLTRPCEIWGQAVGGPVWRSMWGDVGFVFRLTTGQRVWSHITWADLQDNKTITGHWDWINFKHWMLGICCDPCEDYTCIDQEQLQVSSSHCLLMLMFKLKPLHRFGPVYNCPRLTPN